MKVNQCFLSFLLDAFDFLVLIYGDMSFDGYDIVNYRVHDFYTCVCQSATMIMTPVCAINFFSFCYRPYIFTTIYASSIHKFGGPFFRTQREEW